MELQDKTARESETMETKARKMARKVYETIYGLGGNRTRFSRTIIEIEAWIVDGEAQGLTIDELAEL
jgi:hypothetical protein